MPTCTNYAVMHYDRNRNTVFCYRQKFNARHLRATAKPFLQHKIGTGDIGAIFKDYFFETAYFDNEMQASDYRLLFEDFLAFSGFKTEGELNRKTKSFIFTNYNTDIAVEPQTTLDNSFNTLIGNSDELIFYSNGAFLFDLNELFVGSDV